LLDLVSGADAVRIIKMLGLDHIKGTSSANLRKIVRDALDKVPDEQDLAMLPYMPVFWLLPTNYHRVKMLELNQQLIQERQKNKLVTQKDTDTNGFVRVNAIDALHKLAKDGDRIYRRTYELDYKLPAMKVYHDVLQSIIKFDDSDLDGFDLNEHMQVMDQVSQFVMMMDEKPQYKGLMKEYEKFLEEIEG